jgi:glycerophosphoryl diester phosphodiesterase
VDGKLQTVAGFNRALMVWASNGDTLPIAKIAHRGARKFAPENSIPAFEKAIEMEMDYIEIDVRATSDGALVLSHDSTLDRMTGVGGKVAEMTLGQIKKLDAGRTFGSDYGATEIPTLQETLELARGRIGIYLDLKEAPVPKVVAVLDEYGMVGDTVVYSDVGILRKIKSLRPDLAVMPGPGRWLSVPGIASAIVKNLPAEVVDSNLVDWSREAVEEVHGAGGLVYVDTLGQKDNREGMLEAIEMGVDGIDTDHPDILLEVLQEAGEA